MKPRPRIKWYSAEWGHDLPGAFEIVLAVWYHGETDCYNVAESYRDRERNWYMVDGSTASPVWRVSNWSPLPELPDPAQAVVLQETWEMRGE